MKQYNIIIDVLGGWFRDLEDELNELVGSKSKGVKSNEDMIFALAGQFKQLSHEPEKFSGDSTGFEPMTSVMPVQCSNQLNYEVTQLRAGQFVGLMFSLKGMSYERNVI